MRYRLIAYTIFRRIKDGIKRTKLPVLPFPESPCRRTTPRSEKTGKMGQHRTYNSWEIRTRARGVALNDLGFAVIIVCINARVQQRH